MIEQLYGRVMLKALFQVNMLFGVCFATGVAVVSLSLERMRKEINRLLPPEKSIDYWPKVWRLGDLLMKSNIAYVSLEVIDQHRVRYPASRLRKIYAFGLLGTVLAFVGLILTEF